MPDQGPTPRETLAAAILTDNPAWTVRAYPWTPRQVAKGDVAVCVWRASLAPRPGTDLELAHELTINVYLPKTDGDGAEAEGDEALDELLLTLQRIPGVAWSKAERTVFDNVISGWQITAAVNSKNYYRQAVLAERP
jgi:hypothetical protein